MDFNIHIGHGDMNDALKAFIREHDRLFWSVRKDARKHMSVDAVVETILNYGGMDDIKQLFSLIGVDEAAKIFFKQISRKRMNYHPRTAHFFKLYFKKHAQGYTHS